MENWYCVYTKANQADSVCRKLTELQHIEVLNPKMKGRKYLRHRHQEVLEDLFPCYFFSRFEASRYYHLLKYTRGVRRIVGDSSGAPYIVDESIIDAIKSRMKNGVVECDRAPFSAGESVVVKDGPLCGLTGVFMAELKPNERIMILLDAIQFHGRVDLPIDSIARPE